MGAYLSSPSVEKTSDDFIDSEKFSYGVSLMQGWRISMEDAHSCVPKFGENKSLFGVYDGHGGSEVALYCALYFTEILKDLPEFNEGKYEEALKKTFMSLDKVLLEPDTIRELKVLADRDVNTGRPTATEIREAEEREEAEECEEDEMELLHEEATMSIEDLLERYGQAANETKAAIDAAREKVKLENEKENAESCSSSSSSKMDSNISETKTEVPGSSSVTTAENDAGSSTSTNSKESDNITIEASSSTDVNAECSSSKKPTEFSEATSSNESAAQSTELQSSNISSTIESCKSSSSGEKTSENTNKHEDNEVKNESVNENAKGEPESSETKENVKVTSSSVKVQQKVKPVKLKTTPIPTQEGGGDFGADSDSESSEEGFDSDEAVGGSSDSEEESDDEEEEDEEEEENIDISELPSLAPVRATTEEPGKDSGTTAVVAFLSGHELFVANAGDSRCVLCRNGEAVDLSEDHKPEDESEIKRIEAAGGRVNMQGRVNGGLNLSRAIGDHCYKMNTSLELENQMISAMPDVKKINLQPGDKFMVLACDGIWNVFSSQEVVDFVLGRLPAPDSKDETKISTICEELMDTCIAPDTTGDGTGCDNMTCIIVRFDDSWLKKSNSTNSTTIESTEEMAKKGNNIDNDTILKNNTLDGEVPIDTNSDITKPNHDLNGKNGTLVENADTPGCKRQRTVKEDGNEIVEQQAKKQKVT